MWATWRISIAVAMASVVLAVVMAVRAPGDSKVFITDTPDVGAIAAAPDGGLYFSNRSTGDVRKASADGVVEPDPVLHLDVSSDGQRGLIGLATAPDGRLFATWTEANQGKRIVVAQVSPGSPRIFWAGPSSTDLANGGRLAYSSATGRVVVGIGDLLEASKISDPAAPNGKMLSLDPKQALNQTPTVLSSGWNNPFAFTYDATGRLWVADNSPGDDERLAASGNDGKPSQVKKIGERNAPSGLTFAGDSLYVCLYNARRLDRYWVDAEGQAHKRGTAAENCSLATTTLNDGRVVFADDQQIRILR